MQVIQLQKEIKIIKKNKEVIVFVHENWWESNYSCHFIFKLGEVKKEKKTNSKWDRGAYSSHLSRTVSGLG